MSRENIKVFVRFRPVLGKEKTVEVKKKVSFDFIDTQNVKAQSVGGRNFNRIFTFDTVFPPNSSQQYVYEACAKGIVDQVIEGTIFAYGQTGSGKTFSMLGSEKDALFVNPDLKGIIPRVAETLFEKVESFAKKDVHIRVSVEYCELYLGKIFDLLGEEKKELRIRENLKEIYVEGLTQKKVTTKTDIIEYLKYGSKHRIHRATEMNARSSRSHTIFTVRFEQVNVLTSTTRCGKFNLVDLAGSECVAKSGTAKEAFQETKTINTSLLYLGNVINALVDRKKHVPYRDSSLTRILQESLGGNSKTSIIVCVSPHPYNFQETVASLRFGERAKKIKCTVTANVLKSREELMRIIEMLKKQVVVLGKKNLALIREMEKLNGKKLSRSDLAVIYKTIFAKKKSKGGSNQSPSMEEDNMENLEDLQNGDVFDLGVDMDSSANFAERAMEVEKWKLQIEDVRNELAEKIIRFGEERGNFENRISELKKLNDGYLLKLKRTERENEQLEKDIQTLVQGKEENSEKIIMEFRKQVQDGERRYEELQLFFNKIQEEKLAALKKVEEYESYGYGPRVKETMDMHIKEIASLKEELEKNKISAMEVIREREATIQKLKKSNGKRTTKNFKLLFDIKRLKKEIERLKEAGKEEKEKIVVEYEEKLDKEKLNLKCTKEIYEKEIEEERQEREVKEEELKNNFEEEKKTLLEETEKEMKIKFEEELKKELEEKSKEYEEIKNGNEEKVKALLESTLKEKLESISESKKKIEEILESKEIEVEDLNKEFESKISGLQEEFEGKMKEVQISHEEEVKSQIEENKSTYEEKIKEIESSHNSILEEKVKEQETRDKLNEDKILKNTETLESKHEEEKEEMKGVHEKAVNSLKDDFRNYRKEYNEFVLKEKEEEIERLQKEMQAYMDEFEEQRKKLQKKKFRLFCK